MDKFKTTYIECACTSTEHTLCLRGFPEEKELYINLQLPKQKFFKRLIAGIKYIFGYQSRYGHWDECLLDEEKFCEFFNKMVLFAHQAGIKQPTAKKIKSALNEITNGKTNSAVPDGLHSEKDRNVLAKHKK